MMLPLKHTFKSWFIVKQCVKYVYTVLHYGQKYVYTVLQKWDVEE